MREDGFYDLPLLNGEYARDRPCCAQNVDHQKIWRGVGMHIAVLMKNLHHDRRWTATKSKAYATLLAGDCSQRTVSEATARTLKTQMWRSGTEKTT